MKKTLITIAIIGVAGGVIALGFFLRSKSSRNASPETANNSGTVGLPVAGSSAGGAAGETTGGSLAGLSSPTLPEIIAYFVRPDGAIVSVGKDGKISLTTQSSSTLLTTQTIDGIASAEFSADGKKILLKISGTDSLSPNWRVYDVSKNSWRTLTIETTQAVFSPQNESIAYFSRKLSGVTLTTLDLSRDTSKPVTFLFLAAEGLSLTWTDPDTIVIGETPSGNVTGSLWSFSMKTRRLSQITAEGSGMSIRSYPGGHKLLFKADNGGSLSLLQKDFSVEQSFAFLTLPSKCAFYMAASSSEVIVCGIPQDTAAFRSATLPDDYETQASMTSDSLVYLSINDGVIHRVSVNDAIHVDISEVRVVGNDAYFINRWDDKLYKQPLQ